MTKKTITALSWPVLLCFCLRLAAAGGYFPAKLPPSPVSLTATNFGTVATDLSWARAGGVVEGNLVERVPGTGVFECLAALPAASTAFRDPWLQASTAYAHRATATDCLYDSPALSVTAPTGPANDRTFPGPAFANVCDFGYMWWENSAATPVYAIKTSRYAFSFNTVKFTPTAFFPLASLPSEAVVLGETQAASFPPSPPVTFGCKFIANGTTNSVTALSTNSRDVQLVECGKFFQRRWHKVKLGGGPALNSQLSGLEVAAWPDRISFVLRLVPANPVTNATVEMTLGLTNAYDVLLTCGGGSALKAAGGSGFVFLKSVGSSTLNVDITNALITVRTEVTHWNGGQERSVGLIVYPSAANVAIALTNAVAGEASPMALRATGTVPSVGALIASYDADRGHYRIVLPPNGTAGDNGILRAHVVITNTSSSPRVARINFDGAPFYIPGLTAVLRDDDSNPIGIPVQLSKNWHGPNPPVGFAGWWFHGLTMLTVPARTNLSFELAMVGQNWGGMPSATHSQLSVIGYGGNQQWDESALGNFGEALCYDVDHVLTDNDCTDSRPMLTTNAHGKTGAWGANAGGASFLRYYDIRGQQRRHSRMRTRYVRYCPNLAEAVFAGQTDDGAMEFSYSAALYRSDDYTRAVHRLQVDVKSNLSFSRLVFFQQAADTYAYNNGTTLAYGDALNLIPPREWTATFGKNQYISTPVALTGPRPWAMTLDSPAESGYAAANRGFVIHSWRARINGMNNVPPYLAERSIAKGSILDVVPPPGVTTLKAGDYVEAEIVRFYVPKFATNYYGSNANFRAALTNYQNSYQIGLREAVGNNLAVTTQRGTLERLFPIQIQAINNRAGFTVTGGLGCVPVTFTGLSDYRAPVLEEKVGGAWEPLNQAVNGDDFWQCDYNAEKGAWEITFTLKLDGTTYADTHSLMTAPQTRTFRFRMGGARSPRVSAMTPVTYGQVILAATGEPGPNYALLTNSNFLLPRLSWAVVTHGTMAANRFTPVNLATIPAQQRFCALRTL
jgi:hypothetical protein